VCHSGIGYVLTGMCQGGRHRGVHKKCSLAVKTAEPVDVALECCRVFSEDLDKVRNPHKIREFLAPVPERFCCCFVYLSGLVIKHDLMLVIED